MFGLSATEIFAILIVALIVFGPKQLPKLASKLGKTLRELRQASQEIKAGFESDLLRGEQIEPPDAGVAAPGRRASEQAVSATTRAGAAAPLGASAQVAPGAQAGELRRDSSLEGNDEAPLPAIDPVAHPAPTEPGVLTGPSPVEGDPGARDPRRPDAGI